MGMTTLHETVSALVDMCGGYARVASAAQGTNMKRKVCRCCGVVFVVRNAFDDPNLCRNCAEGVQAGEQEKEGEE